MSSSVKLLLFTESSWPSLSKEKYIKLMMKLKLKSNLKGMHFSGQEFQSVSPIFSVGIDLITKSLCWYFGKWLRNRWCPKLWFVCQDPCGGNLRKRSWSFWSFVLVICHRCTSTPAPHKTPSPCPPKHTLMKPSLYLLWIVSFQYLEGICSIVRVVTHKAYRSALPSNCTI